LLISWERNR